MLGGFGLSLIALRTQQLEVIYLLKVAKRRMKHRFGEVLRELDAGQLDKVEDIKVV